MNIHLCRFAVVATLAVLVGAPPAARSVDPKTAKRIDE